MFRPSTNQVECTFLGKAPQASEYELKRFAASSLLPPVSDRASIITFDGFDGVGKSPLARGLASAMGAGLVGLDTYLQKNMGCFLEALRLEELQKAIEQELSRGRRVIVEGCLVEAALEKVGMHSDFRFYVVQVSRPPGIPDYEYVVEHDVLYGKLTYDELLAKDKEKQALAAEFLGEATETGDDVFWLEKVRYHLERRPHYNADAIVKVISP